MVTSVLVTPRVLHEDAAVCPPPSALEAIPAPMPIPNQATFASPAEVELLGLNGDRGVTGTLILPEPKTCPLPEMVRVGDVVYIAESFGFSCHDAGSVGSNVADDRGVFEEPNFAEQLRSTVQPPKSPNTADWSFLFELYRRGDY
jgi:hypothetical protein